MAATVLKTSKSTYSFSSQPRVLQDLNKRSSFRQNSEKQADDNRTFSNIMFDRRVVRGNTHAVQTLPATNQPDPIEIQRRQEAKRRALARRKLREQARIRTPDPIPGRKHIDIQTEVYLEELSDRIEEVDVDVQTDYFLDRPSSPLFIPQLSGQDASTQINNGELFDFDLEVKPIVETLVGKTTEQALVEIAEEEELAEIREQQRHFEELRNIEVIEFQRLEEQERRLRAEKIRRIQQTEEAIRQDKETMQKLSARAFSKAYLQDLVPSVFKNLREQGYFYDAVEHDIETSFMPWLMDETMNQVNRILISRMMLDSIIREVMEKRIDDYQKLDELLQQMVFFEDPYETDQSVDDMVLRSDGAGSAQDELQFNPESQLADRLTTESVTDYPEDE